MESKWNLFMGFIWLIILVINIANYLISNNSIFLVAFVLNLALTIIYFVLVFKDNR